MIEVQDLSKIFGSVRAVDNLSFGIREGEFYGLLGPNGAGKTTTISVLSTLIKPDSGKVVIRGHDLSRDPYSIRRAIGVVPQEIALYEELTALENLRFWGSLYGLAYSGLKQVSTEMLKLTGLLERKNERVGNFSGGMKRRLNIACALLHRPAILLMDEPTVGIDPQSRNMIFEMLSDLHKNGLTIIYTTHYMEEAQRLCDRIGIIDHGKIIAQGSLEELEKLSATPGLIVVHTTGLTEAEEERYKTELKGLWKTEQGSLYFRSDDPEGELAEVIGHCHNAGVHIRQVQVKEANLESIFLDLTGRQLRD